MRIKTLLKGAFAASAVAAFGLVAGGAASAQSCAVTQFEDSKKGELYLAAETEAMANKNFSAALSKINQLRALQLNCYEEGAVLGLSAFIKMENGDLQGAARDLQTSLSKGYIPADKRATTLFNIAQIYLQSENLTESLRYMEKWLQAGGRPDRTQKWQLAVLYQRADRFPDSVKWAEEVLRDDGPNAKQEVYDFLLFLYDRTGQRAKKAAILEKLLQRDPTNRKYWDAVSGDYFAGGEERKAFEVQKAMYLGGLLTNKDELMRVVNFYNRFNAPYHAARILEKEMNAGRIPKDLKNLELLANLYQVAREHKKAIPVIREAANKGGGGKMYERLGRSYGDLGQWKESEDAMRKAIQAGGLKDVGNAWVTIGQARYELKDRAGAREAFKKANNRAGRSWLQFMDSEIATARALKCFEATAPVLALENEEKVCKRLSVVAEEDRPAGCKTVKERIAAAQEKLANTAACNRS